jgi:hypothetical protein
MDNLESILVARPTDGSRVRIIILHADCETMDLSGTGTG